MRFQFENNRKLLQCLAIIKHLASQNTKQKMKFSIKYFFIKCDQIHRKLRISSHFMTKSLDENFIFCAVFPMGTISVLLIDFDNYIGYMKVCSNKDLTLELHSHHQYTFSSFEFFIYLKVRSIKLIK